MSSREGSEERRRARSSQPRAARSNHGRLSEVTAAIEHPPFEGPPSSQSTQRWDREGSLLPPLATRPT
jgi:hypothetical protein